MWRNPNSRLADIAAELEFPLIVRPRGSHAGVGLAKLDDRAAIGRYLAERPEAEFFVSRFVDYASDDGLFRKYRIVFVDGKPYACHMAIADRWDIWYLNAGMSDSVRQASRRRDLHAHLRHRLCAPPRHRAGRHGRAHRPRLFHGRLRGNQATATLLIFEADNTAVVHNMDSPEVFPYKPPQMRKIFDAFAAMLYRRATAAQEHAA